MRCVHGVGDGERVGAGRELDRHAGRGLAVELEVEAIALRAELDARDVAQPDRRAVRIGAQDDVRELLRRA